MDLVRGGRTRGRGLGVQHCIRGCWQSQLRRIRMRDQRLTPHRRSGHWPPYISLHVAYEATSHRLMISQCNCRHTIFHQPLCSHSIQEGRIFVIYSRLEDSHQDGNPDRTSLVVVDLAGRHLKVHHAASSSPYQRPCGPSDPPGLGPLLCCRMWGSMPSTHDTPPHSPCQTSCPRCSTHQLPPSGRWRSRGWRLPAQCPATNTHVTMSTKHTNSTHGLSPDFRRIIVYKDAGLMSVLQLKTGRARVDK